MALNEVDWSSVYSSRDVNESLPRFLHIFNRISNEHAASKSVRVKSTNSKPWITSGLKKSMKVRDRLYKKWLSRQNLLFLNQYKLYRNKITSINKFYRISLGTSIYGLYRYVPPNRVWFLRFSVLK